MADGASAGPYHTLEAAKNAGAVTLNLGIFINVLISFFIISFSVFMLVKGLNKLRSLEADKEVQAAEATTKECPYCFSNIPVQATRCPQCTSDLSVQGEVAG